MTNLVDTGLERDCVARETDKAVLVRVPNGVTGLNPDRLVWLPKSQVQWIAPGCYGESIHIPAWLARRNGL